MSRMTLNRYGVLTEDIYYQILEELSIRSPNHLLSASLVSHAFHTFSSVFLFRTIELGDRVGKTDKALLRRLARCTSLCSYVHQLTLREGGRTMGKSVERLLRILPHMTHLKSLHAYTAVAFPVIPAITRTNPAVRLHVYLDGSDMSQLFSSEYKKIFGPSPNLVSIDARTHYAGERDCLNGIQYLALSSTNLSSLVLNVDSHGCVIREKTIGDMTFRNGERLSSLRKLSVDGAEPNDSWAKGIPWEALEDVYFSIFPVILHTVVEEMQNLRSIKLRVKEYWYIDEDRLELINSINDFLLRLPSALEELDLEELTADIPVSTIIRFGGSLKRLRLHILEMYEIPGTRQVLSVQRLEELCAACIKLEDLQIDINRNGEWPYDILDAVAKFPQLKKLTLSLELGIEAEEFLRPYATHYSSVQIYKYIACHRQSLSLLPLIELTVELGGHRKKGRGRPASWVLWEEDRQVTYKVVPAERFEDAKSGLLEVWTHGARRGDNRAFFGPVGGNTVDDERIAAWHKRHGSLRDEYSSGDDF